MPLFSPRDEPRDLNESLFPGKSQTTSDDFQPMFGALEVADVGLPELCPPVTEIRQIISKRLHEEAPSQQVVSVTNGRFAVTGITVEEARNLPFRRGRR